MRPPCWSGSDGCNGTRGSAPWRPPRRTRISTTRTLRNKRHAAPADAPVPGGRRALPRVPDRSLTPVEPLPAVAIRASGSHAFVYRKMVEGPVGAAAPNPGDLVRVLDRDGRHLGFALWNGRSQISLRFLSRQEIPPGPDFWSRRIAEAVGL